MRHGVWALLCAAALVGACGDDLGAVGDACTTSSECETGLLCDTSLKKPVCAQMVAPHPDLAGVDLSGADLSASTQDLAHVD
jgi:hypothetical protein